VDSHQVTGFGHKLDYLKSLVRATDGEIGNSVGVVASLVCRWRSGERTLDRGRDGRMLGQLAQFFLDRAVVTRTQDSSIS
jgi:hypothetical protein